MRGLRLASESLLADMNDFDQLLLLAAIAPMAQLYGE